MNKQRILEVRLDDKNSKISKKRFRNDYVGVHVLQRKRCIKIS